MTWGKIDVNSLWLSFLINKMKLLTSPSGISWVSHSLLLSLPTQNQLTEQLTHVATLLPWPPLLFCTPTHRLGMFIPLLVLSLPFPTPPCSAKSPPPVFMCSLKASDCASLLNHLSLICKSPFLLSLKGPVTLFSQSTPFCHCHSKHFSHLCVCPNSPHEKMFSIFCLPL